MQLSTGISFVALVVSGGHTELVHARGLGDYELLGRTRDADGSAAAEPCELAHE